jgi:Holliday junction resolvasome RuvABC endonuclease subunit
MTHTTRKRPLVLGFHPSFKGFGWVLFDDEPSLLDWGTVDIEGARNAAALERIEALLDRYRPAVLAVEAHDDAKSRRSRRIRRLYGAVARAAEARGVAVCRYSRAQIASSRLMNGARTREEVAKAVVECLSVLRPRLPKPRRLWVGEHPAMQLFCAAACVLAYFDAEQLQ